MDIPLVERTKIQAQVLVPLVKALQAELGEHRANAIVRKALGSLYRKYGEEWWRRHGAWPRGDDGLWRSRAAGERGWNMWVAEFAAFGPPETAVRLIERPDPGDPGVDEVVIAAELRKGGLCG